MHPSSTPTLTSLIEVGVAYDGRGIAKNVHDTDYPQINDIQDADDGQKAPDNINNLKACASLAQTLLVDSWPS